MLEEFVTIIGGSTETVIDGFDTVFGPNVGKCGVMWNIIKCLTLLALTLLDLVTGILGFQEFRNLIRSYLAGNPGLLPFLIMWVTGYVGETLLCCNLSCQIVFSIYVICKMHTRVGPELPTHLEHKVQKLKRCRLLWSKVNNILMFGFSDCMVGLGRVLIAFKLPAQVSFLQTPAERLSSIVAFTATCIQILLATGQLTWNLVRSKKRTGKYCSKECLWDIFVLFLMCMALAPPAMSMFIAIGAFDVEEEFKLNLPWLIAPPFGLFAILSMFVLIMTVWFRNST